VSAPGLGDTLAEIDEALFLRKAYPELAHQRLQRQQLAISVDEGVEIRLVAEKARCFRRAPPPSRTSILETLPLSRECSCQRKPVFGLSGP